MGKKASPAPPPETLTARIDTVAQTYFIAADGDEGSRVEDEAILSVMGVIEYIGPRYQRFLGQSLEMTLLCARSFPGKEWSPRVDKPVLHPFQLQKNQRSLMAYLPGDAFWALSPMISARHVTHVEATFPGLRYGTADLLSIYFHRNINKVPE